MEYKINKLIVEDPKGNSHVLEGGSATPGPNSVDSETIVDEGVKKQDLDRSIQEKLDALDEGNIVTEEEIDDEWNAALRNAGLDLGGGTQEAGAGSGEVSGDGGDLDE